MLIRCLKKQCHDYHSNSACRFTVKQVDGVPSFPDDLQNDVEFATIDLN